MTQAAVSYQVKSLEERLGAPLFIREKGRARLTPLGLRLLPALSSAFDAIEAAFASHREEDETLLTITTTHTFANTWLAWRLGGFQMEHPDLAVRMTTSNELCDLRGGDADVEFAPATGAGRAWRNIDYSNPNSPRWPAPNALERWRGSSAGRFSRATCPIRRGLTRATIGGSNGSPTMVFQRTNRSSSGGHTAGELGERGHAAMAGLGLPR